MNPQQPNEFTPKAFFPQLNSLRGIAALSVVVSHYSNESGLLNKLLGIGGGQIGVMLFFILSAFLMFTLYYDAEKTSPWRFMQKRFARIFPLFALAVLVSFCLGYVSPQYNLFEINKTNLLKHFYFYQGNSVLWTIGPEIIFYCAFFLVLMLPKYIAKYLVFSICVMVLMTFESFNNTTFPALGNLGERFYVYKFFIIGALLYFIHKHLSLTTLPPWLDSLCGMALLLSCLLIYPQVHQRLFGYSLPQYGWNSLIPALLLSLLLLGTFWLRSLRWLFSLSLFVYLGEISFSMYLSHLFVLKVLTLHGIVKANGLNLMLFISLVVVVSTLLFFFFEKPCREKLGKISITKKRQKCSPLHNLDYGTS